jgi:hypothetical protein
VSNSWSNGYIEWTNEKTAFLSVVFSWHLDKAYSRAIWYKNLGYNVRAGGPAISLNPDYLADVAEISGQVDALSRHNPNATFTTRGCIRKCPFCAVPKIEPEFIELTDWQPKPIVCDNNLLAASRAHFDRVIDRLKKLSGVDFNQGLDARLLTKYHADRLTELNLYAVRLAWDNSRYEKSFMSAFETLREVGIPSKLIRVYVLIGFDDTPEDALYRLETVKKLGALTNPMRYQPLDSQRRNQYVAPGWSDRELNRFMCYWSNLKIVRPIPFNEWYRGRRYNNNNGLHLTPLPGLD